MQKIVIEKPGGFDQLKIQFFPDPVADNDEVVVKIKAIGVNYADCIIRMGYYKSALVFVGWPITPGFDFSGEVIETGPSSAVKVVSATQVRSRSATMRAPSRSVSGRMMINSSPP